jgi:magnesium chelatase family protein
VKPLEEIDVIPVSSLAQAVGFFAGQIDIPPVPSRVEELFETFAKYDEDFADVRGQEMAKRAITVAASGNHNILIL